MENIITIICDSCNYRKRDVKQIYEPKKATLVRVSYCPKCEKKNNHVGDYYEELYFDQFNNPILE